MDSHRRIGRQMQRAREDAGLEQEDAARRLGIHAVTLSRYETGKRTIPDEVLARMRELYRRGDEGKPPVKHEADPRVWHGEMRATLRTIGAMRKAASALAEMADAAESSVRGLVESGALLASAGPPEELIFRGNIDHITDPELRAEIRRVHRLVEQVRVREEREARERGTPPDDQVARGA